MSCGPCGKLARRELVRRLVVLLLILAAACTAFIGDQCAMADSRGCGPCFPTWFMPGTTWTVKDASSNTMTSLTDAGSAGYWTAGGIGTQAFSTLDDGGIYSHANNILGVWSASGEVYYNNAADAAELSRVYYGFPSTVKDPSGNVMSTLEDGGTTGYFKMGAAGTRAYDVGDGTDGGLYEYANNIPGIWSPGQSYAFAASAGGSLDGGLVVVGGSYWRFYDSTFSNVVASLTDLGTTGAVDSSQFRAYGDLTNMLDFSTANTSKLFGDSGVTLDAGAGATTVTLTDNAVYSIATGKTHSFKVNGTEEFDVADGGVHIRNAVRVGDTSHAGKDVAVITGFLSNNASLTFPGAGSAVCVATSLTVSGVVADESPCTIGYSYNDIDTDYDVSCAVAGANTVTVNACCHNAGGCTTISGVNMRALVTSISGP